MLFADRRCCWSHVDVALSGTYVDGVFPEPWLSVHEESRIFPDVLPLVFDEAHLIERKSGHIDSMPADDRTAELEGGSAVFPVDTAHNREMTVVVPRRDPRANASMLWTAFSAFAPGTSPVPGSM